MLLPKRVKYRRVHRGRMKGVATRGNKVSNGEYGLQTLEPAWITSNQIEAARVAMTVTSSVAVRFGSRSSPTSPSPRSLLVPEWVPVRAHPSSGLPWLSPAALCSRSAAFPRIWPARLCVWLLTSCLLSASS